jgi:HAD superfamily hydrolase (TIGR01509 family)
MGFPPSPFSSNLFPQAVLSDMDGLLLDTERLSKSSFDQVAASLGISDGEAIFPQLIGLNPAGHQQVFANLLPSHIEAAEFDALWKSRFFEMLNGDVPLKAGAHDLLSYLKDHNVPVAVVTSSIRSKAEDMLRRSGLIGYIDMLVAGDDVTQGKPHPDIYIKAAECLGIRAATCLALEDSNNGVRAAYGAGAVVVQIPDLMPPDDDARRMTHAAVSCLDDLYTLFGWPPCR